MLGGITFHFNERKAAAAAALLLELAGGSMEYLKLIKLLYFADREGLDVLQRPLSGDRYVAMKDGPVLSRVYDLIKQTIFGKPGAGPWSEQIERAGRYDVRLKARPDVGALSQAEINILMQVFQRYGSRDKWSVRDETHRRLPEWEDPGASSREISIEEILEVLGKTDAEIEAIRRQAAEDAHFDRIFGA